MRGLFRSALALFALGMTQIGCSKSGAPDPAEDGSKRPPGGVTFHVPGMS